MTKLLILILFAFPAFATSDFEKVRTEIEVQQQRRNSSLKSQVDRLIAINKLPQDSFFSLAGPDLLQPGNEQTLHECTEKGCFYYERNFFRQISDIRSEKRFPYSEIKAWPVGIYAHIMRVWISNEKGELLKLESETIKVDAVIFL